MQSAIELRFLPIPKSDLSVAEIQSVLGDTPDDSHWDETDFNDLLPPEHIVNGGPGHDDL